MLSIKTSLFIKFFSVENVSNYMEISSAVPPSPQSIKSFSIQESKNKVFFIIKVIRQLIKAIDRVDKLYNNESAFQRAIWNQRFVT